MNHNKNTMVEFGEKIVVNGKVRKYNNGKPRIHGKNKNGEPRKIRKDKQSSEPTKTGNI